MGVEMKVFCLFVIHYHHLVGYLLSYWGNLMEVNLWNQNPRISSSISGNSFFYASVSWYYYDYHLFVYLLIRVFHISVSWWSFTGDWVTTSLLKSPGLFSVFWPFSIMLLFGWSPLGRQLPNPPGPLISFSYRAKCANHNWYNCHLHVP